MYCMASAIQKLCPSIYFSNSNSSWHHFCSIPNVLMDSLKMNPWQFTDGFAGYMICLMHYKQLEWNISNKRGFWYSNDKEAQKMGFSLNAEQLMFFLLRKRIFLYPLIKAFQTNFGVSHTDSIAFTIFKKRVYGERSHICYSLIHSPRSPVWATA